MKRESFVLVPLNASAIYEREIIESVRRLGSVRAAAEELGVDRYRLYRFLHAQGYELRYSTVIKQENHSDSGD